MVQLQASPILVANTMAFLFTIGNVPGCAREIGLTNVLGSAPYTLLSAQKSLDAVASLAWISNPITASYVSFLSCMKAAKLGRIPVFA